MNIFRRLKNIWLLSGLDIPQEPKTKKTMNKMLDSFTSKKARIVELDDPLEEFMKKT